MGKKKVAKKKTKKKETQGARKLAKVTAGRPSPVVDTRVIYCGDNLEQLKRLPDGCVDLMDGMDLMDPIDLVDRMDRRNQLRC